MKQALFAAGCFWGVEAAFKQLKGVMETEVGYTGGTTENPTYNQVCYEDTGHAEAVRIKYDPKQITYNQLLDTFWKIHDPTTKNRQSPDVGSQYRSAIFYYDEERKQQAELSKNKQPNRDMIVTEIQPKTTFYKAEEYHQSYFEKHGKTCSFQP